MIEKVEISKGAKKNLKSVPQQIFRKLMSWVGAVEKSGIEEVRKIPGYHDEPLFGDRKGQRSIRLNLNWRAIYIIKSNGVEFVEVQEVNKHDY
jgi:proteic killer suppression protein